MRGTYHQRFKSFQRRFWEKVEKQKRVTSPHVSTPCWMWKSSTKGDRGSLWVNGKSQSAPRISYMIRYGKFNPRLGVLHKCDTPMCVNPSHLFLGTPKDNAVDRSKKGRTYIARGDQHWSHKNPEKVLRGERVWKAKLTIKQVLKIRKSYKPNIVTMKMLAKQNKVSIPTIKAIVYRVNWRLAA